MVIHVIGAGAWGTALAHHWSCHLTPNQSVFLWGHESESFSALYQTRTHASLPKLKISPDLNFRYLSSWTKNKIVSLYNDYEYSNKDNKSSKDNKNAKAGKEIFVIIAVPSIFFMEVLHQISSSLIECTTNSLYASIIVATKGFHPVSGNYLTNEVEKHFSTISTIPTISTSVIAGSSFALELAQNAPTGLTIASSTIDEACHIGEILMTPYLFFSFSSDVFGVQFTSVAKNILAIGMGFLEALQAACNTKALFFTLFFQEIMRAGKKLNIEPELLCSFSGLGDMFLSCTSLISRNMAHGYRFVQISQKGLQNNKEEKERTVEGAKNIGLFLNKAKEKDIDLPITRFIHAVLCGTIKPSHMLAYFTHLHENILK